jgi:hypothetical protein
MDTYKMFRMIRAIEDCYIEDFPKIVAECWKLDEEDNQDKRDLTEIMQEEDMTWSRVGMMIDLGYLDTDADTLGPLHEKIENIDEDDSKKFIEMQIAAERSFLPDEALKALLSEYAKDDPNGERIIKKSFKAAYGRENLGFVLMGIIRE